MRADKRRDAIAAWTLDGVTSVDVLSAEFGVSPSTIRRDLGRLAAEGRVARTYGGAMHAPAALERSLREKDQGLPAEKEMIAAAAAARIGPGETVIIDAGTTTGRLAWHLRYREDLRVITNGVNTVATLSAAEGIEVIVVGGQLRPATQALLGAMTESALRRLTADKAFLGCDGLLAGGGLSSPTLGHTYVKGLMMSQAHEVFVLADHSKLGSAPFPFWTPTEDQPYTLITDEGASEEQLAPFHADDHADIVISRPTQAA